MAIYVIDTIKPKNDKFPAVESVDVSVDGYASLADAVTHFATNETINTINANINTKANSTDVATADQNLQGQINQIVISASAEGVVAPEVAAARVGAGGISYETLKSRLDSENVNLKKIVDSNKSIIDKNFGFVNYGYDKPFSRAADATSADSRRIGIDRNEESVVLNGDTVWTDPETTAAVCVRLSGDVASVFGVSNVTAWDTGIHFTPGHDYMVTAELISGTSTVNGEEYINGVSIYKTGTAVSVGNDRREGKKFFRTFTAGDYEYNVSIYIPKGQQFVNASYIITIEDLTADSILKSISGLNNDIESLGTFAKIDYDATSEGACTYKGEKIDVTRKVYVPQFHMSLDIATTTSVQGGAVYGDYYIQLTDQFASFSIIDLKNKSVLQHSQLTPVSTYHCNNANFSDVFYDANDVFPLLYVSMENIAEHKVLVYRLVGDIGEITLQLIQTITFDAPETCHCYYPNACIDNDNELIIQIGYSTNSYQKSSTNELVFNVFSLPSLSSTDIDLPDSDKISSFTLPSLHAAQGAFVYDGKLYQTYGISGERWIKAIDVSRGKIVTSINLNNQSTITGEQETLFAWNDELYIVGVNKNVFKLSTSTKNYVPAKKVLITPEALNGFSCAAEANKGALVYHRQYDARTTIMTKKNGVNETFSLPLGDWTRIASYPDVDAAARQIMASYGLIKIPEGAMSVKLTMTNSDYYYGLVIVSREKADASHGDRVYDSGWRLGGVTLEHDLSGLDYETYEYGIASTLKIGSAGTEPFTNETVQSLGWAYKFTF